MRSEYVGHDLSSSSEESQWHQQIRSAGPKVSHIDLNKKDIVKTFLLYKNYDNLFAALRPLELNVISDKRKVHISYSSI